MFVLASLLLSCNAALMYTPPATGFWSPIPDDGSSPFRSVAYKEIVGMKENVKAADPVKLFQPVLQIGERTCGPYVAVDAEGRISQGPAVLPANVDCISESSQAYVRKTKVGDDVVFVYAYYRPSKLLQVPWYMGFNDGYSNPWFMVGVWFQAGSKHPTSVTTVLGKNDLSRHFTTVKDSTGVRPIIKVSYDGTSTKEVSRDHKNDLKPQDLLLWDFMEPKPKATLQKYAWCHFGGILNIRVKQYCSAFPLRDDEFPAIVKAMHESLEAELSSPAHAIA